MLFDLVLDEPTHRSVYGINPLHLIDPHVSFGTFDVFKCWVHSNRFIASCMNYDWADQAN